MATSGSTDFSVSENDILKSAHVRAGVLDANETMSSDMETTGRMNLNLMVKEWIAEGMRLWKIKRLTLWLDSAQVKYQLSSSTGEHFTESFVETAVKTAAVSGASSLDVDSTTGITAADYIGVVQDDNTIHWTTVASVTDSDTLVLTAALTDDCAVDNPVFAYTSKAARPVRLLTARRKESGSSDVPLQVISMDEYDALANKTTTGTAVSVAYDRHTPSGDVYVWPAPSDENIYLELTCETLIEDFDAQTNTPDFPIEWGNALIWNLAETIGIEYGVPDKTLARVRMKAGESKNKVAMFDTDNTPIFFQPEY